MSRLQQTQGVQLPQEQTQATMVQLLLKNIGRSVIAEFMTGLNEMICKKGEIRAASENYLILTDANTGAEIACDMYSLRFVTFCPMENTQSETETQEAAPEAQTQPETQSPIPVNGAEAVFATARPLTQAAFNYARRKTRRIE